MNARTLLEALRSDVPTGADLRASILALVRAHARRHDHAGVYAATLGLARDLSLLSARADLAGRVSMRLDVKGPRPDRFASSPAYARFGAIVPVSFDEALRDLAEREPVLVRPLRDAAARVRDLYGATEGPNGERVYAHGFSLAHAIDQQVVEKVRDLISSGIYRGQSTDDVSRSVADELGDWTTAYAETVVRTNTTTAYSAGRLREARQLADEGDDVGFEFQTAGDVDVRSGRSKDHGENHAAMDGVRARQDDRVWDYFTPPLGYSCRCLLVPVLGGPWNANALALARASGARAAPGFGNRTDG